MGTGIAPVCHRDVDSYCGRSALPLTPVSVSARNDDLTIHMWESCGMRPAGIRVWLHACHPTLSVHMSMVKRNTGTHEVVLREHAQSSHGSIYTFFLLFPLMLVVIFHRVFLVSFILIHRKRREPSPTLHLHAKQPLNLVDGLTPPQCRAELIEPRSATTAHSRSAFSSTRPQRTRRSTHH